MQRTSARILIHKVDPTVFPSGGYPVIRAGPLTLRRLQCGNMMNEAVASSDAAVRTCAESILPDGKLLAIEETSIGTSGWSAERVSTIIRQFQELEQPDLEKILDKPKKD